MKSRMKTVVVSIALALFFGCGDSYDAGERDAGDPTYERHAKCCDCLEEAGYTDKGNKCLKVSRGTCIDEYYNVLSYCDCWNYCASECGVPEDC